jgi:molecular chaperone DnaK
VERILNEPTAAAIAFGFDRRLSRRVFVYDFGGGTFDISILNIDNDTFEVEATGGDTFLGGIDFDRRLMDIILERFEKKEGKSLRDDKVAIQRIFDACEIAKIELSSATESRVIIPAITVIRNSSVSISEKITREEFEDRVRDLVDRSLMLCDATLSEIQMGREDIDDVVLVGGQTRMPLIRRQIRDFFSKEPLYKVNPSEAVAIGAAIVADSIYRQSKIDFKDVLPQSIGFSPDGKRYIRIVPKNSRLPVKKEFIMLNNRDNSTEMDVVIYQGDSPYIEANEILGVLSIRGITPALKNFIKIKVTIEIDSESILRFSAVELPDERRLETVFEKYNIDMMCTDTTILDI